MSIKISLIKRKHLSCLRLINALVLINSIFLIERERERERRAGLFLIHKCIAHARKYNHFFLSENLSLVLFLLKYIFSVLSYCKVLKRKVMCISLMTNCAFSISTPVFLNFYSVLITKSQYFRCSVYFK